MADIIGLYVHASGAETGGTNALTGLLTGGTAISAADAETAAFAFGALDTVYTLYYKAEDGGVDVGKDTTAAFTVTCPTGVVACKTWNGTFEAAPTDIPAAVGAYKPLYVKQTARQAGAEADLEVGTGGVTFVAGTRVGQVTTFAASDGNTESVLTWDAISGESGFIIEYCAKSTDPGTGSWTAETGYTSTTASADATTKTITGLTNGTKYWFRCRAWAATGLGAWSATVTTYATAAFYPTTGDGYIGIGSVATFATARDGDSDAWANTTLDTNQALRANGTLSGGVWYVNRSLLPFDTSSLPDDATIVSVGLRLTVGLKGANGGDAIHVVTTSNTSIASGSGGGFATANWGASSLGNIAASVELDTPTDVTVTGLTINKTGATYVGLRGNGDLANSATADAYMHLYSVENSTTSYRPLLTVTYY